MLRVVVAVVVGLAVVGCGDTTDPSEVTGGLGASSSPVGSPSMPVSDEVDSPEVTDGLVGSPTPEASPSMPVSDDVVMVTCGGLEYEQGAEATGPDGSTLAGEAASAVDDVGEPALEDPVSWTVVVEDEDRVELVRELDQPEDFGGGDVRTHEHRTLERLTGVPDLPDGTWMVMSRGPCLPRVVPPAGLGEAHVALAEEPHPQDTTVELLVTERDCASGQSAEGRIELVELVELDDRVLVHIGVQPPPGNAHTCQGNPPDPFAIELDEPIGDRELMDASAAPPVALDVWSEPY